MIRTPDFFGPLDMATMYPDQNADPLDPASYEFAASDRVFAAILRGGFEPYLRLGDTWYKRRLRVWSSPSSSSICSSRTTPWSCPTIYSKFTCRQRAANVYSVYFQKQRRMNMRSLIILLSLALALTACARLKRVVNPPPAAPATVAEATVSPPTAPGAVSSATVPTPTASSATEAPPAASARPTPDFAAMTFVEKNNLYLELLAARQAEGVDTTAAEEAYARSLDATLEGDGALADQYLIEAILLLWR